MRQDSNIAEPDKRDMVQGSIRFTEDLWRRAKIAAAEHGTTLQQICQDGLELRLTQLDRNKEKK